MTRLPIELLIALLTGQTAAPETAATNPEGPQEPGPMSLTGPGARQRLGQGPSSGNGGPSYAGAGVGPPAPAAALGTPGRGPEPVGLPRMPKDQYGPQPRTPADPMDLFRRMVEGPYGPGGGLHTGGGDGNGDGEFLKWLQTQDQETLRQIMEQVKADQEAKKFRQQQGLFLGAGGGLAGQANQFARRELGQDEPITPSQAKGVVDKWVRAGTSKPTRPDIWAKAGVTEEQAQAQRQAKVDRLRGQTRRQRLGQAVSGRPSSAAWVEDLGLDKDPSARYVTVTQVGDGPEQRSAPTSREAAMAGMDRASQQAGRETLPLKRRFDLAMKALVG